MKEYPLLSNVSFANKDAHETSCSFRFMSDGKLLYPKEANMLIWDTEELIR